MSAPTPPELTVALFTQDDFGSIARTVGHVTAQDVASRIELLILAAEPSRVIPDPGTVSALHSVRVVPVSFTGGSGAARARAVREAAAPVIAFGEDHCFPQPGWARALLEAHRGPWAGVGPVVTNANPTTTISWADLLLGYGPWLAPGRSGEVDHLPGHNTSYKRDALLPLGDELEQWMEAETPLQWLLRREGGRLYLSADARAAHTNFEHWGPWFSVHYHGGRVFAATRARAWPAWRRAAFAAATPLVPLVRLRRHLGQARAAGWTSSRVASVAPTLFLGLVIDGFGQFVGTVAGAGKSRAALAGWEFHRNEPRARRGAPRA